MAVVCIFGLYFKTSCVFRIMLGNSILLCHNQLISGNTNEVERVTLKYFIFHLVWSRIRIYFQVWGRI